MIIASRYKLLSKIADIGQSSEQKFVGRDINTGKKVFIKIGSNFKKLEMEYNAQKYFYKKIKKINNAKVITPMPMALFTYSNQTIMVTEFLKMKDIFRVRPSLKAKIYSEVVSFLNSLNSEPNLSQTKNIKRVTVKYILFTIPYFSIKNLLNGLDIKTLVKGLLYFWKVLPNFIGLKSTTPCHGDINTTNILLNGHKIVMLDFGDAVISHRYFDVSKAINSSWYQPKFSDSFFDELISRKLLLKSDLKIFGAFSLYNLMQRMSTPLSFKKRNFYIKQFNKFLSYEKY